MAPTPDPTGISSPSPATMTAAIDRTLHAIGFEFELISPEKVAGRLKVTTTCCQPFDVLNGGVSALIAETLASFGAYVATGFRRVVGVQLSTNHLKPAVLGEEVEAEARPIQKGKTIQVWEVQIQKRDPSTTGSKVLLSTSRVTLICNQQASESMKSYEETLKKYAKL
ncbi:1,4-dihydroxy-2-naphthoyl-CoA thioesterase 1-like [Phoenix dactylifera]|uniref:1,4-dihydroxy-2-naphthoyl-CoA thioesterase 1-like n=1 Tax=Phoenix dactylifera TaxID=42345 RepID=A0A8B7BK59_PHODC|nr:1,4-dihydroxy-2-naphthoyl-CoA thioesterase 1-like [Phoenix dactylifera]